MNKKLLSLAVAGVLAGGMGIAQADVTVYGLAHVSIDRVTDTCDVNTVPCNLISKATNVASNSSRLGFKGSEDLGGGIKAVWQMENQIVMDGESGALSARNRFAGLSGGFGTALVGIQDTPLKIIGRAVELFPEYVGDARNITAQTYWDMRPANMISYSTPNMGGFGVMAAYVTDWQGATGTGTTAPTDTDNDRYSAYGVNATYKGGPVYVGLAYEERDLGTSGIGPLATTSPTDSMLRLTASGTFGAVRVVALYQQAVDAAGTVGADRVTYGAGGSFTLGNHVIKAQYYMADDRDNNAAGDTGGKMMAVGYDYNFSKTTTGYVAYAKTTNDGNATFQVNGGGHGDSTTPLADADPTAMSVGLIVKF